MNQNEILTFWFDECIPEQWFKKDSEFDETIRDRFSDVYWRVVKGETSDWRDTPEGRLAEVIVLDQFARNIFRDTAQAFAHDPLALALAQEAVRNGDDKELSSNTKRQFLYMPFMHSESPKVHETALFLFQTLGDDVVKHEIGHKKIIDRFGRYPHRNEILGRTSTSEEIAFLKEHKGF